MDIKRIVMAGGILATAGAIGFVMQHGDSAKARYETASVPDISGTANDPLVVTDIALTSAVSGEVPEKATTTAPAETDVMAEMAEATAMPKDEVAMPEIRTAALGDVAIPEMDAPELSAPVSLCEINMSAEPVAAAMVDISLNASCYPNERVTFHHNGMMFTEATDNEGNLKLSIPALSEKAVFIAAFANGEGALANADVSSLEFYDRFVVQSKSESELHINAFEFGAKFRDAGHVNAESGRTLADAATGIGGFITTHGDAIQGDALIAEVYTFPIATVKQEGDVHVSVDVEVTPANCGLRVEGQTIEVRRAGELKVQDLSLPIPECDAVGDFLVLQNLLQDLKVARN